jgi:hypothetical protein
MIKFHITICNLMNKKISYWQIFVLILIFAIFAYFRFNNLDKRIGFDWDQEQFSTQIREIVKNHKLTLLGPRVTSDKGFFLAPYFTYFLIPFYLTTNLHPIALLVFLVIFNILFFITAYFIIKKIFGFLPAICFLLLWSINPVLTTHDTIAWWPIFIPIGIIIVWLILFNIYKKNTSINWICLGLALGFFINMHFQFAFMIVFSFIFLLIYYLIKNKNYLRIKNISLFLLTFICLFIPLIIFDLRHNFLNLNLILNFFINGGVDTQKADPNIWFLVFSNIIQPFVYSKIPLFISLFYFVILIMLYYLFLNKKDFAKVFYLSTLILWIIFPIIFALFGKRPSEYYFIFLYPFLIITITDFFVTLKQIFLFLSLCMIMLFVNWNNLINNTNINFFSLYYKDQLIKKLVPYTVNKKFNISYSVPLGYNNGYKYLLDYYNVKQSDNWNDPLIQIKIPIDKECDLVSGYMGVIIPKELE